MRRISQFLQAVITHWGVLVTGGFAIGVLGIWQGTGHRVSPWVYWTVAIAGLILAFFKAWNDQVNNKEQALTKIIEIRKEFEASANAADPLLALMRERQRLEIELQPLLEMEERGIKVIPQLKIGKDESDYRTERIARLRRDIRDIGEQLAAQRDAISPAASLGAPEWQTLAEKFRKLSVETRANWTRDTEGIESWDISGGGQDRECETLCQLAGAMLLRSTHVSANLSDKMRTEPNPMFRWLYFLKDNRAPMNYMHGITVPTEGPGKIFLSGIIGALAHVSYLACIRCASLEV